MLPKNALLAIGKTVTSKQRGEREAEEGRNNKAAKTEGTQQDYASEVDDVSRRNEVT